MKLRAIFLFCAITLFVFSGLYLFKEKPVSEKQRLSGALEGMQLMAAQRAYPDDVVSDSKYFEAWQKLLENPNVDLREDTEPWESLGPHNTAGRTLALAFNPQNPNTIYAGSASGGLWRSYNMGKGVSWEYVPTGFPVLGISSVVVSPVDTSDIYIGTGEVYNYRNAGTGAANRATRGTYGIGILKSSDSGQTWTKSLDWSESDQTGINEIKLAPTNPDIVVAATTEGTYKSKDAGLTWDKIHNVIMATDLVIDPNDSDVIIVGCGNFGSVGRGIYRTVDGGKTWIKAGNPIPNGFQGKITLDMSPSNPDYVYASIGNGFGSADGATWLCRSTDNGETWEVVNETDYSKWQGWFAHDIAVNPQDELDLVMVGIDIWKSTNGGDSITEISSGGIIFGTPLIGEPEGPDNFSHSDHHVVIYHPSDTSIVLYGNDGGVNLSEDNGYTFQTVNGGYQTIQFYNGFSLSQSNSDFAIGGLQDNSTVIYRGTKAWTRSVGGDGSWTAVNTFDDNIVFASAQFLNVFRSSDNAQSFNFSLPIPSQNEWTSFIAPYVLAPSNPTTIYAGRGRVYKSVDSGNLFEATNNNQQLNGDPVFAMAVSPINPDVVLVATAPFNAVRGVFITTNGGDNWSSVVSGLPTLFPTDVCFSPDDEGTAYITFGGFGSGHVYKTSNYGQNWTNITSNLPNVPTSAIAVDPDASHHLYVGNDLGVWVSIDAGDSWEAYDDGLFGPMLVMDLKIMNNDRKLYMATHGNGAFRRDLVETTSSIAEEKLEFQGIKIFPNPSEDILNVEFESLVNTVVQYSIFTITGQLLITDYQDISQGLNSKLIDVSSLKSGNYLLKIQDGKSDQTLKFTVI